MRLSKDLSTPISLILYPYKENILQQWFLDFCCPQDRTIHFKDKVEESMKLGDRNFEYTCKNVHTFF